MENNATISLIFLVAALPLGYGMGHVLTHLKNRLGGRHGK